MHVRRTTTGGQQMPASKATVFADALFDLVAVSGAKNDRLALQACCGNPPQSRVRHADCPAMISPTAGIAGEPRTVGRPREEERQRVVADDGTGFVWHGCKYCTGVQFLQGGTSWVRGGGCGAVGAGRWVRGGGCGAVGAGRWVRGGEAWRVGRCVTRSPRVSTRGFLCAGVGGVRGRCQEAPGGSPGTPGVKAAPSSMLKRPALLLRNAHTRGTRDRDSTRCPPASAGGFL